jgi:hypothetical protein
VTNLVSAAPFCDFVVSPSGEIQSGRRSAQIQRRNAEKGSGGRGFEVEVRGPLVPGKWSPAVCFGVLQRSRQKPINEALKKRVQHVAIPATQMRRVVKMQQWTFIRSLTEEHSTPGACPSSSQVRLRNMRTGAYRSCIAVDGQSRSSQNAHGSSFAFI